MAGTADFIVRLVDKMTGPSKGIVRSLSDVHDGINMVGGPLKALAITGVESLAKVGLQVGRTAVEFADFGQRSEFALNQLAKGGVTGAQLFTHIRGVAEDLGIGVQGTTKNFTKLLAAQFDPTLATNIIKMGADLQVLGAGADEVGSAILAITQIKSTGKLQGDELNQLVGAGVSAELVYKSLAKQMGKTIPEVQKLKEAGKIDADTAIAGIMDAVLHKVGGKEAGEAGKKFADTTLKGMAGRFMAQGENVLVTLGQAVLPGAMKAFGAVGNAITGFLKSDAGTSFMTDLGNGISRVAGFIADAVPLVKEFISSFASGFSGTFEDVKAALSIFTGPDGAGSIGIIKTIGKTIGQLAAIAVGAGALFVGAVAAIGTGATIAWSAVTGAINGIIATIGGLIAPILDTFANISAIFDSTGLSWGEKFLAIGKQIVMGLVNGIQALAMLPITAIQNIASGVVASAKGTLGIASPSKEMEWLGEMTAAGFEQGIGNMDQIGPRVASMVAPPSSVALGGAGGAGGGVEVNVRIQVDGSGDPRSVAEEVERILTYRLNGAFDDMALNAAAA